MDSDNCHDRVLLPYKPMERRVDITVVYACCVLSMLLALCCPAATSAVLALYGGLTGLASVACFLVSVICVLGCEWSGCGWRAALPAAYCVIAVAVPAGVFFVPAALYELMRSVHEPLPWKVAPAAALFPAVALAARGGVAPALLLVVAVAALAALLSMRTCALTAQRDLTRRTRDDLVERELCVRDALAAVRAAPGGPGVTDEGAAAGAGAIAGASAAAAAEPDARPREFECLTEREYEIVRLVAEGLDNHEIAAEAFISEGTVRNRISSVLSKTGYKNRTQLAVAWWRSRSL